MGHKWILAYVSDQIDKRQYGRVTEGPINYTHALIDIVHHWSKTWTTASLYALYSCITL